MLKAPPKKPKKAKLEYADFVELFEKASARASEAGGFTGPAEPVTLKDQAASLVWVAEMAACGTDWEETGGTVWLGSCTLPFDEDEDEDDNGNEDEDDNGNEDDEEEEEHSIEYDIMVTPLAWAVINGLPLVAEALLSHGADPAFKFNLQECGAEDVVISVSDLAAGWSEAGYRACDCADLIASALEARQIAEATTTPGKRKPAKTQVL